MSDEKKCFTRPKVRFSRSADSPEKLDTAAAFTKPKIRSIVDFRPPIKILKAPTAVDHYERSSSPDETSQRYSAGDAPNDLRLCPKKTTSASSPCLTEIVLTPDNRSTKIPGVPEKREANKPTETLKKSSSTLSEKSSKSQKSKDASSGQSVSQSKLLSENRRGKENIAASKDPNENISASRETRKNTAASRESKENIPKVPENTPRTQSDAGTRSATVKSSSKPISAKKSEAPSKPSREVRKSVKSKPVSIGLMPCMKAASKDRSKSAPTKKTILRDATAAPSQVYVGPGIPRPRSLEPESRTRQQPLRSRSEILSGDKLSRPEYNSIVNTIRKLKEAREERIAPDLEHLPAVYRRLINGKVSSALDFGANEAIYRDLVDLSIDEKQLPSRLTRSKDPEPRQRDLVPKLSDFFVPRNDEEYRKAVLVRPPSPRVLDTWNPYRVSDRIFSWKESLDHDL